MTTLDLSALATLSVLLEERHVTRAARRLGVTQSTMSHRLAQLREALGDPLLVRGPAGLVPSERAHRMAAPLAAALAELAAIVRAEAPASLERLERKVTLVLPDLLAPFLPDLREGLARDAPHVTLIIRPLVGNLEATMAQEGGMLAIAPSHLAAPGLRSRPLGQVRLAVAGRRGHPAFRRWCLETWLASPHVTVDVGMGAENPLDAFLVERGHSRRVELVVPSFLTGLVTVADSNLLMNVPSGLTQSVARRLGLVLRPLPLALPSTRLLLLWHERAQHDAGLTLLRDWLSAFLARKLEEDSSKPAHARASAK